MSRGRAYRHHTEAVAKAAVRLRLRRWRDGAEPSGKEIGRMAQTKHGCSGPCCGNPRRWFGLRTVQELRAAEGEAPDRDFATS